MERSTRSSRRRRKRRRNNSIYREATAMINEDSLAHNIEINNIMVDNHSTGQDQMKIKGWSEIRMAAEELAAAAAEKRGSINGVIDQQQEEMKQIPTLVFVGLSNLLLNVLDKIGPTMCVLRQDIQRNVERLEDIYVSNPSIYSSVVEILKKEAADGTSKKKDSCSRAVLWLTRSMDFSLALLERLERDPEMRLDQMVEEAYSSTLKPWHGWISSAAYKVALMLIPDRDILISLLIGEGQDFSSLKGEIKNLIELLHPFLDEIHNYLGMFKLDALKSV